MTAVQALNEINDMVNFEIRISAREPRFIHNLESDIYALETPADPDDGLILWVYEQIMMRR